MMYILCVANCGHPELSFSSIASNDSHTPNTLGYDSEDLPIEGKTVRFDCPPGSMLTGPNSATCSENGEWEPDPSQLICKKG